MRGRASGFGARISSMVLLIVAWVTPHRKFVVVLGDLRLDEGNLLLGQSIPLVELGVCPTFF